MREQMLTIVQPVGERGVRCANGTRFFFEDGRELKDVTRCVVTFVADEIVKAVLDVAIDQVENIEAHPLLSLESVKEAATLYGFDLVKKP